MPKHISTIEVCDNVGMPSFLQTTLNAFFWRSQQLFHAKIALHFSSLTLNFAFHKKTLCCYLDWLEIDFGKTFCAPKIGHKLL